MLKQSQRGISLVEILIGLSVGLILTFGMVVFYANTSRVNNSTLAIARLEYEMQTAIKMMKEDIRRAGFNAASINLVGTGTVNPFMETGVTDITVPAASCILFAYDLDKNGNLPALGYASSDERFGYRLSNQIIQTRAASDASFDCNAGSWHNLTNPNLIQITNLNFTLTETVEPLDAANPGGSSITVRSVAISMTGQLASDNAIQRTLTAEVRVRNDKYQP